MARTLVFEILGEDASAQRAIQRTSRSLTGLDRNVGRAVRGAAAGSGVFRSLGRSLAFASGGFLAFASGADFLRKSVDQAKQAAVTQAQLAAQFKAAGVALRPYQKEIDRTTLKLSGLAGFDDDELKAEFTTIFRSTRDVSKGLRDTALAADIARGRHISLASAGTLVAKVEAGNIGLLRRMGVQVKKNATVEQALASARARFAGQAVAGTTAQERFGAALQNSEEIIGGALLPTLNRYLTEGASWLQQMNESGRLQHDVASASKDVSKAIRDGVAIFNVARAAIQGIDRVTGSLENTLKALATTWLLLKVRTKAIEWGVIASGERVVGSAATVAAAEVGGLEGSLTRLKNIGPVPVAIALSFIPAAGSSKNPNAFSNNPAAKGFAHLPVVGPLFSQANRLSDFLNNALGITPAAPSALPGVTSTGSPSFETRGSPQRANALAAEAAAAAKEAQKIAAEAKKSTSLLGKFNILQLHLADAERTNNTILQRSILVSEEQLLLQLRDQAKTLVKRTDFAQQAASVADQIRAIDAANVSHAKKAAAAAKKASTAAADFSVPLILQVAQARAEALGKPTTAILEKIRTVAQKAIKSGRLGLQGQLSAWQTIADVNGQLQDSAKSAATIFQKASTKKLLAGVNLSAADERKLRARFSQLGAGGTIPTAGFGAFGVPVTPNGDVIQHTTINMDGKKVASSVTRHQQRSRRRNPQQRRGFAGAY